MKLQLLYGTESCIVKGFAVFGIALRLSAIFRKRPLGCIAAEPALHTFDLGWEKLCKATKKLLRRAIKRKMFLLFVYENKLIIFKYIFTNKMQEYPC